MTERAVDMAKAAPEDPYCGLAKKSELVAAWNVDELELSDDQAEPRQKNLKIKQRKQNISLLKISLLIKCNLRVLHTEDKNSFICN